MSAQVIPGVVPDKLRARANVLRGGHGNRITHLTVTQNVQSGTLSPGSSARRRKIQRIEALGVDTKIKKDALLMPNDCLPSFDS